MARIATIQLKIHGTVVQTIPLEGADITTICAALKKVDKSLRNRERLVDLFYQLEKRAQGANEPAAGSTPV